LEKYDKMRIRRMHGFIGPLHLGKEGRLAFHSISRQILTLLYERDHFPSIPTIPATEKGLQPPGYLDLTTH